MILTFRKILKAIFVLFFFINFTRADGANYFATVSTIKARAIAMGGAFVAVKGGPVSALYNPAAINLYRFPKGHRLTVFLNPIGASLLASERNIFWRDSNASYIDGMFVLGLLVKSIALTVGPTETMLVFSEESMDLIRNRKSNQFFQGQDLLDRHASVGVFSIKLAEQISLGVSGTYYTFLLRNQVTRRLGLSYGVLLRPNARWNVGLSYVDLPRQYPGARHELEFIEDEAVNFGVSYLFLRNTLFSFEVRNISNEEKWNNRELHFGAEHSIFTHFAIRLGYFREHYQNHDYFSAGIGLLNLNKLKPDENELNYSDFLINYGLVRQTGNGLNDTWHLLTCLIRF